MRYANLVNARPSHVQRISLRLYSLLVDREGFRERGALRHFSFGGPKHV